MEPNFRGHRMDYCRYLVDFCRASDRDVVLATTSDTLASEEFRLRFPADQPVFNLGGLVDIGRGRPYFSWLRAKVREISRAFPGHQLLVLEGDKFLTSAMLLRLDKRNLSPIRLLLMRSPHESLKDSGHPRDVLKALLARSARIFGVGVVVLQPATRIAKRYTYRGFAATPDPVVLHSNAREIATFQLERLGGGRTWFGVFGNITARKNLDLIAAGLSACTNASEIGLLVAGQLSDSEAARCEGALVAMQGAGVKLVRAIGVLSPSDLDAAIGAVDVVVVAHSTDGPSGIVGKALALGSYVIASGAPVLRDELKQYPRSGQFISLEAAALAEAAEGLVRRSTVEVTPVRLADSTEFARSLLDDR